MTQTPDDYVEEMIDKEIAKIRREVGERLGPEAVYRHARDIVNARLAEVAPDLLEVLKGLTVEAAALCAWRREQGNPDEETEYWIDKAHAAIDKAEGRG